MLTKLPLALAVRGEPRAEEPLQAEIVALGKALRPHLCCESASWCICSLLAGRALAVLAHLMRIGSKNRNIIAACRSVNRMSEGL